MKKKYFYATLLFILGFSITGCNMSFNSNINKVLLYKEGTISTLNHNDYDSENCFNDISKQYSLLIMNTDISKVMESGIGIEMIFKSDLTYNIKPINKTKVFSRAFVPLSGEYKYFLFLGNSDGYGSYTPYGIVSCDLIKGIIE